MPITNYPPAAIMLANDDGVVTADVDDELDCAYTVAMYRSLKPGEEANIDFIPDIPVIRIDVVDVLSADPDYNRDDPHDRRTAAVRLLTDGRPRCPARAPASRTRRRSNHRGVNR